MSAPGDSGLMERVWSRDRERELWLEILLAHLTARARLQLVPAEDAAGIAHAARKAVAIGTADLKAHDTPAALMQTLLKRVGTRGERWLEPAPPDADVVATAWALQIREAGGVVLNGVYDALAAVVSRADEHALTLHHVRSQDGRIFATTFGVRFAGWAFELHRDRRRVSVALDGARVGRLCGMDDPELERLACAELALRPADPSVDARYGDRVADVACSLAILGGSLEGFTSWVAELANLSREAGWPSGIEDTCDPEQRTGELAGLARANAFAAVGAVGTLEALPAVRGIFLAVDDMLTAFTGLIASLVVRPDRMRRDAGTPGPRTGSPRIDSVHAVFDRLHAITRDEGSLYS